MDDCPVCATRRTRIQFKRLGYSVRRCHGCGLRFAPVELTPSSLAALYGPEYFTTGAPGYRDYLGDEATHRWQASRYLDRIERLGVRPGRLLDVGCAAGFFLDEARRRGWKVRGCEISGYAAGYARDRLGLPVDSGSFLELDYAPGAFDCITLLNVFEHLPDPVEAARRLVAALRPGGLLVLETWNADSLAARLLGSRWHQWGPPHVPFYYNRQSLDRLFHRPQWTPIQFGAWTKWITLRRGCDVIAGALADAAPARLLRRLGASRLGAVRLPYSLGDLVLATYRRAAAPERRQGPRERRERARPMTSMGQRVRHDRRGAPPRSGLAGARA